MSKKYVLELDPTTISRLLREYRTQILVKNREWHQLPNHLQVDSYRLIFDTCTAHLKKSPVIEKLNDLAANADNMEAYKDDLYELIEKLKETPQLELSPLVNVKNKIVGLVQKDLDTLEEYHAAVVNIAKSYELEDLLFRTCKDHSERPGYFEGERIPKFSKDTFLHDGAEFFKNSTVPIDDEIIKYILYFYHQDAVGSIRFFFLTQFENTLCSEARVEFEYDRRHPYDIVVCEDGSVKFYFIEYMLSKDSSKGLIAKQQFVVHVKKALGYNDNIESQLGFKDISVNIEALRFEIVDEDYLRLLLSIELPKTINRITEGGCVSEIDSSLFNVCTQYYKDCSTVESLKIAAKDGGIDAYGLFALCWSSHYYRSIILKDKYLCSLLQNHPAQHALFSILKDRSYRSEVIRKIEVKAVSSPEKKKPKWALGKRSRMEVEKFSSSADDEGIVEVVRDFLGREKKIDAYKGTLKNVKKPGKLAKICNASQARKDEEDPDRLLFKAFIELFKASPTHYIDAFLSMSVDVHDECLSNMEFLEKLLHPGNLDKIVEKSELTFSVLGAIKENYDVYPGASRHCLQTFIPRLSKVTRRKMLQDKSWQKIFFKMFSNDLSCLAIVENLIQGVDMGCWLVLQGGDVTQRRYFLMSLFALKEELLPKKAPLEKALKKLTKKKKSISIEMESKENAAKMIAQTAALSKNVDIDAAEVQANENKGRVDTLEKELKEVSHSQETSQKDLDVFNCQLRAIDEFSKLIFDEPVILSENVLMFEVLGLMYMTTEFKLWRFYKEKFDLDKKSYQEMKPYMNAAQVAYFLGENDDTLLEENIEHLSELIQDPALLIAKIAEDLKSSESVEKLKDYLVELIVNKRVLSSVMVSKQASEWIEELYCAVQENDSFKKENDANEDNDVKETLNDISLCFETLAERVVFTLLNSVEQIKAVFKKEQLPTLITDCAAFPTLTMFMLVALSLSDNPYQLPDVYFERLREANEDDLNLGLQLLETRFGLGSWVFKLFDHWEDPPEEATTLLTRACNTTEDRMAPSEEMIEFLSGLTKETLQKYVSKIFSSSVEEWVPVFVRYPKHERMVGLLLRLPKESTEFTSIATVMLSKPVLDSVILCTAPETLYELAGCLPDSLPRMRELLVLDEKFRLGILKHEPLKNLLYNNLSLEQMIELDLMGVKKLDYMAVSDELSNLSSALLRRSFSCLFNRNDPAVKHFLAIDIVSIMMEDTVDRSEFSLLPNLVRALNIDDHELGYEKSRRCVTEKISCQDFEFAMMDVNPKVLLAMAQLPEKGKEISLLRDQFFKSELLMMRLFLEADDTQLAMLLKRGQSEIIKWVVNKFRVNSKPLKASRESFALEKLTSRLIVCHYGARSKNSSIIGALLSNIKLRHMPRFVVSVDLAERFALQLVHTVGEEDAKIPLLIDVLGKKIKTNDDMDCFLRAFQCLNNAFIRLAPKHLTRSFYRVWASLLELAFTKIIQHKVDRKKLMDMGNELLSAHKWIEYEKRAVIVPKNTNADSETLLHFPCPQLYFLFGLMCNPQQLMKVFASRKTGKLVCEEFLSCVDKEEGAIHLSGNVKIRWLSCFRDVVAVVDKFMHFHKTKDTVKERDFKGTLEEVFGKSRILPQDLSYEMIKRDTVEHQSAEDDSTSSQFSSDEFKSVSDEDEDEDHNRKCVLM